MKPCDFQAQPDASTPPVPAEIEQKTWNLYWHLRWTVPLHIALPIGLWWIMQFDGWLAAQAFFAIHIVGLVLFLVTIKWWWSQSGDLIGLLFINHFATFTVGVFLPW